MNTASRALAVCGCLLPLVSGMAQTPPDSFETLLQRHAASTNSAAERAAVTRALRENHLDNPQLHLAMKMPMMWLTFDAENEALLAAAIDRSPHAQVRATAMAALAEGYSSTLSLVSTLKELGVSVDDFVDGKVREMLGDADAQVKAGKIPPENVAALRRQLADLMQVETWRARSRMDTGLLRARSEALAEEALTVSDDAEIAARARGVLFTLRNVAPGAAVPEISTVTDLDGNPVRLADHKGKVLLLDFWATWCGPCKAAMPHHRGLAQAMKGRPFELITLSVDNDRKDVLKYLDREPLPFTHWHLGPANPVLKDWQIPGFPTLIVIDGNGIIRARPQVDHALLARYIGKLVSDAEAR